MIFCHSDLDGFCSAMIAYLGTGHNRIFPVTYGKSRKKVMESLVGACMKDGEEDIYLLDLSFTTEEIDWIRGYGAILIDHHSTSSELDLSIFKQAVVDVSGQKCASDLVYEYFIDSVGDNSVIKAWVDISHDRDLWINSRYEEGLELSLAISYLLSINKFSESVIKMVKVMPKMVRVIYDQQIKRLRRVLQNSIAIAEKTATIYERGGVRFVFVYCSGFVSDVCKVLREIYGDDVVYVLVYFLKDDVIISFRSTKGNIPVSDIAKELYGGGGHKYSAGGEVTAEQLRGGFTGLFEEICRFLDGDRYER